MCKAKRRRWNLGASLSPCVCVSQVSYTLHSPQVSQVWPDSSWVLAPNYPFKMWYSFTVSFFYDNWNPIVLPENAFLNSSSDVKTICWNVFTWSQLFYRNVTISKHKQLLSFYFLPSPSPCNANRSIKKTLSFLFFLIILLSFKSSGRKDAWLIKFQVIKARNTLRRLLNSCRL